ncbi:MAG: amidohydrolase family protein [Acidobacteria bacterium]|nr:amidohydrolase family protein [Acidobacteriota bacterium]
MQKTWILSLAVLVSLWMSPLMLIQGKAQSALPPEVEVEDHGYADMIVVNGKVVSMDDAGLNESAGNVYEAMAVKRDRIMALGTSERIGRMANSKTKIIDLGGQTVIPGVIETHAHLYGNAQLGAQLGLRTPDRGVNVTVQAGRDVETTRLRVENALKEAITKVQPDDWVLVGITPNPQEGVSSNRLFSWVYDGTLEPRERLDRIAPDNPVKVQVASRANLNSKAWELIEEYLPNLTEYVEEVIEQPNAAEIGLVTVGTMTALTWDIFYRDVPTSLTAELIRRNLEQAVAHGITTFSSRVPHPRIMDGFSLLNREKKMPVRYAALYEVHRRPADPDVTRQFYRMTGNLTGLGNDYLWIHGVASELWDSSFPQVCLGPDIDAAPEVKAREKCPASGEMYWDALRNALEAGWRLAGIHGVGSHGVRLFMQLIEEAMENTGMTAEDIRNLRPTVEHATAISKKPEIIAGLKKYGIIVSAGPPRLLRYPVYREDYGPGIDAFMLPLRTLLDQGVKVVGQNHTYRSVGYFWTVFMTREVEGKVIGPEERLGRVTVLKMWTKWASEYVLKEDDLGSLELGKLADFLVLDKDYLTIPIDQIPAIYPQMTVVGGNTMYMGADFARNQGMEPIGYQFPEGYCPWGKSAE